MEAVLLEETCLTDFVLGLDLITGVKSIFLISVKNEVHTQTISTLEKYLNETQYVGSAEMVAISNELNKLV